MYTEISASHLAARLRDSLGAWALMKGISSRPTRWVSPDEALVSKSIMDSPDQFIVIHIRAPLPLLTQSHQHRPPLSVPCADSEHVHLHLVRHGRTELRFHGTS